jgi:vacuolar-type H+-ATPase subunit E/Vma4
VFQVLQIREDAVQSVLQEAEKKLQGFTTDNAKYKAMLTDLLVQALAKLRQPAALVMGRECDADFIKVSMQIGATPHPE